MLISTTLTASSYPSLRSIFHTGPAFTFLKHGSAHVATETQSMHLLPIGVVFASTPAWGSHSCFGCHISICPALLASSRTYQNQASTLLCKRSAHDSFPSRLKCKQTQFTRPSFILCIFQGVSRNKSTFLHTSVHSFNECLVYSRHYSRCWRYRNEDGERMLLMEPTGNVQYNNEDCSH